MAIKPVLSVERLMSMYTNVEHNKVPSVIMK